MKVQILVDDLGSWIIPYVQEFYNELRENKDLEVSLIHEHKDVEDGDALFLLSCTKLFNNLGVNKYNLVVHESDLPKGKGWSPVTWQVLEGVNKIPVTLFEAQESVDSGEIYFQNFMNLTGKELLPEIKHKQWIATKELVMKFIENYPNITGREQVGESTFYDRRGPKDSQLDIKKSIEEQFNLLRVCDNERYPAWIEVNGVKYNILIEERDE